MPTHENREPRRVRAMFDGIARRYDLLNHLLSANMDRRWRRHAAARVPDAAGALILDLCGGTGDLSIELARRDDGRRVVCCDFSHSMLIRAGSKFARKGLQGSCHLLEADGLCLPLRDGACDAVTVAFGVRNFVDLDAGFREAARVLRPGGRLVVLEFSRPAGRILGPLYRTYLRRILPVLGDRVSRRAGPYGYLARTIAEFPEPAPLAARIRAGGFSECVWTTLTGGIVAIHTATR